MDKFCSNCGQVNKQTNRNCIECGTPFAQESKIQMSKTRSQAQPISAKKKMMISLICAFVVLFAAFYTWGTKSASAETTVSKFIEALREKDAATLKKYMVLSNGDELSEKEAGAFINLYSEATPAELESMATVEKSGKVAGVFDAHKIVFTPQKVSIAFPYDGLKLKLDGESVKGNQNEDGEYVFAGIAPGLHKAEFSYKGEYTEFAHSFELAVGQQSDSSFVHSIFEELPVHSVTISTAVNGMVPAAKSKVYLNEKEIPVEQEGTTKAIGPVAMDGTVNAQSEVELPWGTLKSELVPVTDSYLEIDIQEVPKELKTHLGKRVVLFAEERIKANGTLDTAGLTTVTNSKLQEFKEHINEMKEYDYAYNWSLLEVIYDEDSFYLLNNGNSIMVNAELTVKSDYYSGSNGSDGIETEQYHITLDYDQKNSEWYVDGMEYYGSTYEFESPVTNEGSQKIYKPTKSSSEKNPAEQRSEIESYMSTYNSSSVAAINTGDFSLVSDLLTPDGPRYQQQSKFIEDLYSKGITEEHLSTSLENVEVIGDNIWQVTTIEYFIINGTEKSSEKKFRTITNIDVSGEWLIDELISTKEI